MLHQLELGSADERYPTIPMSWTEIKIWSKVRRRFKLGARSTRTLTWMALVKCKLWLNWAQSQIWPQTKVKSHWCNGPSVSRSVNWWVNLPLNQLVNLWSNQ